MNRVKFKRLTRKFLHGLIDVGAELFWFAIVCAGLVAVGVGVYRDICDWTK